MKHKVLGNNLKPPFSHQFKQIHFGMGCFWGVEKLFWQLKGIWSTAVGYGGSDFENPTYELVCSGETGHAEIVKVVYDPEVIKLNELFSVFWESHNPTQGMRQGNDIGSQYRSMIIVNNTSELNSAEGSMKKVQEILYKNGLKKITTEICIFKNFFYAEDYHQQYLSKNPNGYCNLSGLGINLESI